MIRWRKKVFILFQVEKGLIEEGIFNLLTDLLNIFFLTFPADLQVS